MTTEPARPGRNGEPVLITDAQRSYEEELAVRKRRYKIMMGMRIPCMVAAAALYQIPWLAVGLLVISIPLPWIAVLVANDRLPLKSEKVNRYQPQRPALEARDSTVVETVIDQEPEERPDGPDRPGSSG